MKLKKVASLCGKTKMFCLYDRAERDDVVSQWLGDGYAIYPITGLPYMDEENIYSMFDISAKQQEKIIFRHGPAPEGINLDDVDPTERRLSDDGLSVVYDGGILKPLQTRNGISFIQNKYLSPLEDVIEMVQLYERATPQGTPYIVAKTGFFLAAVIMPYSVINDMPTIQNIISVALQTIQGVVSGALTAIKGIVDVFAGIFTGDWTRVWEGVKGIFSGVWNSLKSIASGALNGIIGLVNGVISGLNKLKIPDWVPGIGGKGINIPLLPTFAKGTKNTPDTFIAGEAGAELVTNARNRTVFNAAETGSIFRNLANAVNTIRAGISVPALQMAYAGATAPSVSAPSVTAGARQSSVVIHSAPVFHVGSDAQAEDIEEMLRRHDEELLDQIDERQRQQEDDERRRNYD